MANTDTTQSETRAASIVTAALSWLLIAWTAAISAICVMALASTLTQSRVSALSIDGVPISIWKLDSVRAQWSQLRAQRAKQKDAFAQAVQERVDAISQQTAAAGVYNEAQQKADSALKRIAAKIKSTNASLATELESDDELGTKVAQLASADLESRPSTDANLKILIASAQKLTDEALTAAAEFQRLSVVVNGLNQKRDLLSAGVKETDDDVTSLFQSFKSPMDAPTQGRLENAMYELYPPGISGIINRLVILQSDVLTLLLVISMGVLGSSLQILHSIFRGQRRESLGSYALRLGTGAVTALVIFIVAKAGVPIVADASKLSGDAPINPYFISFVAIISGLLSEQAILMVLAQGQKFFATGDTGPDRWAVRDLSADVQAPGLSKAALADYLGLTEDDTGDILKGDRKASSDQQQTIAIYLRHTIRELFTDIPPKSVDSTAAQNAPASEGDAAQAGANR